MTARRYLTPKEKADMITKQSGKCGCNCGRSITMQTGEAEHYVPVALGNDGKPDAIWHPTCHKRKTRSDIKRIAKVKRIRKTNGMRKPKERKGARIPSRPFQPAPPAYKHFWKPEKPA